jgi:rare lipoprotein A (peptidoglycan hydrolase)
MLLSTVLSTTVQAKHSGAKKQKHHQTTKYKKKQKRVKSTYTAKKQSALPKTTKSRAKTPDPLEILIANDFSESKVIQSGSASWYGPGFHGRKTASGERFNMYGMTAAHRIVDLVPHRLQFVAESFDLFIRGMLF